MRRYVVFMAGILAAAAVVPSGAQAQFPLDPRALLGRITAPLRHMLPHPHFRQRVIHSPRISAPAHEADTHRAPDAQRVTEVQRSAPAQETSKLGVVGPQVWPSAYQDVIGYTFWPNDYGAAYRQHGFGDITTAILTPAETAPPAAEARRRQPETTGSASSDASSAPPCDTRAARSDWPKVQIEQTVQLNDTQRNALDNLQATINDAANALRASACRDTAALGPMERLEATVQRLWAVQNAGVVIRGALKNFYDALSDEQKSKFRIAPDNQPNESKNAANPMGRQQACAPGAGDDRLMKQILQTVRPTSQQKQSVEVLSKTSAGMAQYLMASCAQPTPDDPLARLDAANDRLTVINYAATSMEVALNQFSSALTDEQRKKFDALGR